MAAEDRLATYGTRALGKRDSDQLRDLDGRWRSGKIWGRLLDAEWDSDLGFPGLILGEHAYEIPVLLFESADLPKHWERLDALQGERYQRVTTIVDVDGEQIEACVYALARRPVG
ncbi:gamma-glutamylcyclotransferase (GGCT)/AIG2-like uncharacterized protein YtfP [Rhizobium mesoamericanum]|uniref:gamma-glutamylcyclotransferase n=1 Tax=Rhizobium mesoamericanum TaxID=1079800 RepID=UPI002783E86C|nr:gamma-glutamylcyclotransferase [Rhizobium mesoamericanum]MDQ0562322.1 gamma-glutamylcyclotransferase (GGCT)/AIG2-like uncharacterized protein YtfP [Rhizobium mesoamericanum]